MSISVVHKTSTAFFGGISSPHSITIPATTSGNTLVVVGMGQADNTPTLSVKLGASSFTFYTGSSVLCQQGINGGELITEVFTLTNIAAGATSVTITDIGFFGVIGCFVIYELTPCTPVSSGAHAWTLDVGGHGASASSFTVQPAALTGTGVTDSNFGVLCFTTASLPASCIAGDCPNTPNPNPSVINSGWALDSSIPGITTNGYSFGTASQLFSGGSSQPTLTTSSAMQGCSTAICSLAGAGGVTGKLVTFQPSTVTTVQLVGNFLDLNGNPLSNGYLTILLPEAITSSGKHLTATSIRVPLDNVGAIAGTLTVYPTDTFVGSYPTPALYRVSVHSADGTKSWKSTHTMTVLSSGGAVQNISACLNLSSD